MFKIQDLGFKIQKPMIQAPRSNVQGTRFKLQELRFEILDPQFTVWILELKILQQAEHKSHGTPLLSGGRSCVISN